MPLQLNWYESIPYLKLKPKIRKVLFVCGGNTGRSPSAEYFFNKKISWWDGMRAFSRGIKVKEVADAWKAGGMNIKFFMEEEVRKVIGDKTSIFLSKHEAIQLGEGDLKRADIIFAMTKRIRDSLHANYPNYKEKIFTLVGFIDRTEFDNSAFLDFPDAYLFPPQRKKANITIGNKQYLNYIKKYVITIEKIKDYTINLIQILYLLKEENKIA